MVATGLIGEGRGAAIVAGGRVAVGGAVAVLVELGVGAAGRVDVLDRTADAGAFVGGSGLAVLDGARTAAEGVAVAVAAGVALATEPNPSPTLAGGISVCQLRSGAVLPGATLETSANWTWLVTAAAGRCHVIVPRGGKKSGVINSPTAAPPSSTPSTIRA